MCIDPFIITETSFEKPEVNKSEIDFQFQCQSFKINDNESFSK